MRVVSSREKKRRLNLGGSSCFAEFSIVRSSSSVQFHSSSNPISFPPFPSPIRAATVMAEALFGSPGGGSDDDSPPRSSYVREQDRYLPIANISRIMKKSLPANGKIAKDAKETVQECVSEFISFITSEASDKCQREKRKTINGDDLLWAMATLGFEDYIDPLKVYLTKYRQMEGDAKGSGKGEGSSGIKRDAASVGHAQPVPTGQLTHQGSFSQGMYPNNQGQHMMVPMSGNE